MLKLFEDCALLMCHGQAVRGLGVSSVSMEVQKQRRLDNCVILCMLMACADAVAVWLRSISRSSSGGGR
jgi:hypothetical protein